MIIVSIKKDGQVTNQGSFDSTQAAQEWLAHHESMKSFGEPTRTVQQQVELSPAVIDEEGNELSPAVTEMQEVTIPGSYVVEIEDKSAELAQEAVNAAALKYLAETDWLITRQIETGVACPENIKAERQAARERIVK